MIKKSKTKFSIFFLLFISLFLINNIYSYDLSTATYDNLFLDTTLQSPPIDLEFSPDGLTLYSFGNSGLNNILYQYSLTTPYDLSTATYSTKSLNVGSIDLSTQGFTFSSDGTKLFFSGNVAPDKVFRYDLTIPYDISTAIYLNQVSIPQVLESFDVGFKPDGLKMYVLGRNHNRIYQYSLTTPYDLTTVTYSGLNHLLSSINTPTGFQFRNNGNFLYYSDFHGKIYQENLTTPYDISTAIYDSVIDTSIITGLSLSSIFIKPLGDKLFISSSVNSKIYRYSLTTYNPVNLQINSPQNNFNFTFDVPNTLLNVSTSINTQCSYTNFDTNISTMFSSTGGLNHLSSLNLPIGINSSQALNLEISCTNTTFTQSKPLTLFKQGVPLNLQIIVPQANQIFDVQTSNIQFYLETNYVTNCNYKRDTNLNYILFNNTGNIIHTTNFLTDLNVSTYNMNFKCNGIYINQSVNRNITFFLDSLNNKFGIVKTTNQLPQVGEDFSGFMQNLTPGLTNFIFNLSIISLIVSLIVVITMVIKKYIK